MFFLSSLSLYGENEFLFPIMTNKSDVFFTIPTVNNGAYYTKVQFCETLAIGAEIELEDFFYLNASAGMHYMFSTNYEFNFAFKGFLGTQGTVEAGFYLFETTIDNHELRFGIAAEGGAFLSRYHSTFTYFFFPSVGGKVVIYLTPQGEKGWFFRFGVVPFVFHLRRDVYSNLWATGIHVSFGMH